MSDKYLHTMSISILASVHAIKDRASARPLAIEAVLSCQVLNELVDLLKDHTKMTCQKASWPLVIIAQEATHLLTPHLSTLATLLTDYPSTTNLRNSIRILSEVRDYGEDIEGLIFERCWEILIDTKQPIACRVFAMTVCTNVAVKYPDLADELSSVIREHEPHGSAGFKVRAREELKRLSGD